MTQIGTRYIETDRLILRRFERPDALAMFENWANDGEVTRFLTWPAHTDVSVTEGILSEWVPQYEDPAYYNWAIVLKENGPQPVGNISVVRWEQEGQVPIVGYCLGRRWWHQGIMTEALGAVISFLFEQVDVGRVETYHDPNNPHSGGVMRKCGMAFQGIREKSDRNNQGVCDAAHYSIEREDR